MFLCILVLVVLQAANTVWQRTGNIWSFSCSQYEKMGLLSHSHTHHTHHTHVHNSFLPTKALDEMLKMIGAETAMNSFVGHKKKE